MRVLVTGAAGFVGVNLVRRFAAGGARVEAVELRPPDAATDAFLADASARVRWGVGDVTDRAGCAELVASTRPDAIVHAAAVTFTPERERGDPAHVFDVNAGGTVNLLEAARLHAVSTFVYVSTGGLYGPAPPLPALDEDTPLQPNNMYAVSKIASEHLCRRYAEVSPLRVRVGRLGTAYGPMERTTGSRANLSAIHQVVRAAARRTDLLRVAGPDVARDFCHIDDVADAFWALTVAPSLPRTVYNVGAPVAEALTTALDAVAEHVAGFTWRTVDEAADADVVQTHANARAAMDLTAISRDAGWLPDRTLEEGLRAYLAWRDDHPEIVAKIESGDSS